ncbi:hypothetical protein MRB53_023889 [Persea americana]|uniref:Uncharacterized protein n=1 Tax=Persea americana TaxID=3435 RepID=A0ACC2LAS7_PERAE|nr:hypothetical protein MRB53_023889 [Persea americana]
MKHHRTHHRSFSPPFEVLKQIGVVDSAAYELLDYGEQEDDMVDYDLYSDLPKVTGASFEGKNETQENFPADKEAIVPEVVGVIPSDEAVVEQAVVADADEEDVYDYARSIAKVQADIVSTKKAT